MEKENEQLKPFLKWAGGKGQLLDNIREVYPKVLGKNIKKYAEPFVGGGAVFFDILNNGKLEQIYISDINEDLINTYKIIKKDVLGLISRLEILQYEYILRNIEEKKLYYYEKRDRFNYIRLDKEKKDNIERAALFIFLNRTCFNGLYRVSKKGKYNVPIGSYKNPNICDKINLINISEKLKNVNIVCGDYSKCEEFVDNNTFVYFDPPYRPLNKTSNFLSYSTNVFDDKSQIQLSKFVDLLDEKGAKIVLSNSDPKNIDKDDLFFDNLYQKYTINRVDATRRINCKSENRGKISELIILNY